MASGVLKRREVVEYLLADRPKNLLVVSGLGSSTWDVSSVGNDARNFCFIGAMGQAGPFALGLAMSQPDKRVMLITGDGEMLMSMGALATIANQAPENLALVVLDNESYVETGNQPTATSGKTSLAVVAKGCGIDNVVEVVGPSQLEDLQAHTRETDGPVFAVVKITAESLPLKFPYSFDGAVAMNRFREAVTGEVG